MPAWKISPPEVETVLGRVVEEAATIATALAGMDTTVESAATATQSAVIGQALMDFFASQKTNLDTISNRINGGVTGAATATQAYINGDLEMAATNQANAVVAAANGDFSAFGGR
jgi:hypothetical protein